MKITRHSELRDGGRQLAQRLAHQARVQADEAVAHLARDLGPRHERRHRVDHDHVDGVRAHQRLDDLERLLARVGLADEQVVELDAQLARVGRVERVLGVDEGADAAAFCALAITCSVSVVLPELSGPKISTMRPRGRPLPPSARSSRSSRSRCRGSP
jgi:hypothetical protein